MRVLLSVICFFASATTAAFSSVSSLETAESKYQQQVQRQNVYFMTLDTMFPDKRVRELAESAARGNITHVNRLLAEGVDINYRGTSDATVLFWAMKDKNSFEHLLSKGADPNVAFKSGGSVIHKAAENKDTWYLDVLLQHGAEPNLVSLANGNTPIFGAIGLDNDELIELLVANKADINFINTTGPKAFKGLTPLFSAYFIGNYKAMYKLLIMNADYTVKIEGMNETLYELLIDDANRLITPSDWLNKSIKWIENDMKKKYKAGTQ
ncbi:ankyrin repeat domain-containing protein [Thaumasiovibrio sp. DFM-14]|uniref:ankyrin repeat domain-containing protein n=1 Tax=Thaumasiovibrio sp. DFM-14 TaxID=3384792 RepID=UPI00399F06C6